MGPASPSPVVGRTKRKYEEITDYWPVACAEIGTLIGELYAIERLVPGPFPGDAAAQTLRQQLRHDRSRLLLDRIWQWATVQVGLPRSDFGKAVRADMDCSARVALPAWQLRLIRTIARSPI
jgi:hypothetical protein